MAEVFTKFTINIGDQTIRRWWELYRATTLLLSNARTSFSLGIEPLTSTDLSVDVRLGAFTTPQLLFVSVIVIDYDNPGVTKRFAVALGDEDDNPIDDRNPDTFKEFVKDMMPKAIQVLNKSIDEDFELNISFHPL